MNLPTTNDFRQIVLQDIPLIDVRAPIEYEKGAFLNSCNLPIMNDEERRLVGICYKEKGNEEATKLGHQLVSGTIRANRIQSWIDQITSHPQTMLYCFRGGSRSRITQEWLTAAMGQDIIRLEGGYKAFRNYLIDTLLPANITSTPIILGGYTGAGKTILLKQLNHAIDLEGIANHRGSSFGKHVTPQPSQINFENNLAYALIKHQAKGYQHMILEDEGQHVGANYLPKDLANYFNQGKLVVVEVPLEERILITLDEYVTQAQAEYIATYNSTEVGLAEWSNYITSSITRLKKRLGGDRYQELLTNFEGACQEQLRTGAIQKHTQWIAPLLRDYYDPMYAYQLKNTTKDIIFTGNAKEVLAYLQSLSLEKCC